MGLKRKSAKPVRGGETIKTHRNYIANLVFYSQLHKDKHSTEKKGCALISPGIKGYFTEAVDCCLFSGIYHMEILLRHLDARVSEQR